MKRSTLLLTAAALVMFGGNAALAECANKSADAGATGAAMGTGTPTGGSGQIAKDGSLAPLQAPGDATNAGTQHKTQNHAAANSDTTGSMNQGGSGKISKDGSTMPLQGAQGGTDSSIATSSQDVAAQQEGQPTAATQDKDSCN